MGIAASAFFVSLVGIVGLFVVKYLELRSGRTVLPSFRARADIRAHELKELMVAARLDLAKLPPLMLRAGRLIVHDIALGFAALARMGERQAHNLADMVSYKHRFEKRETRSEFLKKVAERKNGDSLDSEGDSGHNI